MEVESRGRFSHLKLSSQIGLAVLAVTLAYIVSSFIRGPKQFTQVLVIGLSNGALYALVALGYTMVYGIIELINFAHGDLFMLGSVFAAIFLEEWLGQTKSNATGWFLMVVVMLMVMAVCALINVLIENLAYRRLRNAPKLAPLITAVGVSFILQNFGLLGFMSGSAPRSRKACCRRVRSSLDPSRFASSTWSCSPW